MAHKITWTDLTWNSVWGCLGECNYCYARMQAKRFGIQLGWINKLSKEETQDLIDFKPTFLPINAEKRLPLKSKRIFVDSMSDIAFWDLNWIHFLFKKIKEHPQHTFQILTKYPKLIIKYKFPDNCWVGISAENQENFEKRIEPFKQVDAKHKFVSLEPLTGLIRDTCDFNYIDWIIIGAQTGHHRKPMNIDWVSEIVSNTCNWRNIPVFIKTLDFNGQIIRDIDRFPESLRKREFLAG